MTRQQTRKLVWPEWSHSTSSASSSSSASPVQNTRKFAQLSARKSIVSLARSSSRSSTSSFTNSSLRSSSARNLQRSFTQIASLSPASSISSTISPTRSPARDARDLHRKPMQRLSVSPSRSPSPHDSFRSSSRYSPARDSRRTSTRNAFVSLSRSPRTPHESWHTSSPRESSARTLLHDSSIKSCLFVKNLYVMFHRLSEEEHASQSQRQHAFLELTYRLFVETSISTLSTSSSRFLKRFLQRSKAKLSFWVR